MLPTRPQRTGVFLPQVDWDMCEVVHTPQRVSPHGVTIYWRPGSAQGRPNRDNIGQASCGRASTLPMLSSPTEHGPGRPQCPTREAGTNSPDLRCRKHKPKAAIPTRHFSLSDVMYRMPNIGRSSLDSPARGPFFWFLFFNYVDNSRRATLDHRHGAPPWSKTVPRDASGADRGRAKENRKGHRRGNRVAERSLESAAFNLGIDIMAMPVRSESDIEVAMMPFARQSGSGLVVIPDTFTFERRNLIVPLAAHMNLPAIYGNPYFAREGGLLVYGVTLVI
jgi:hypothetical protein